MAEVVPIHPDRCCYCGATNRIEDRRLFQGMHIYADYCGVCGLTWPMDGIPTKAGTAMMAAQRKQASREKAAEQRAKERQR